MPELTKKQQDEKAKTMAKRAWHASIELDAEEAKTLPTRVMLMKAGNWEDSWKGRLNLSVDDFNEFKKNFDLGIGLPGDGKIGAPIDFSHYSNEGAAGWIKGLEVALSDDPVEAAQGVMCLYSNPTEWSEPGQEALESGTFKCISPSFFPAGRGGWEDPEDMNNCIDNVLVGAGLTNIPFFAGLPPVMASQDGNNVNTAENNVIFINATNNKKGEISMDLDVIRVKDAAAVTDEEKQFLADNKDKLSGDELKKFGLQASTDGGEGGDEQPEAVSDEDRQLIADIRAGKVRTVKEGEQVVDADRVSKLEATAKKYETEKAETIVDAHITRGAIKADQKDRWVNRLLDASDTARKELEDDLTALPSNEQLGKEDGADGGQQVEGDTREQIAQLAGQKIEAAKAKGETLDPAEAQKQVLAEHPDLAEADRKENKIL